ncbi:MAG: alpha/beta hydrolase-fold protein [Byssovorax sp.]
MPRLRDDSSVSRRIPRRDLLLGLSAVALSGCHRSPPSEASLPVEAGPPPPGGAWRVLDFPPAPDYPDGERAQLLVPDAPATTPLLIALHGRGEAGRSLEIGAGAWPKEYELDRLHRRLLAPPLTGGDLQDMFSGARLDRLNASLAAAPYKGLSVGCPATPVLPDRSIEGAQTFARFLIEALLPRMRKETGSTADRAATGIDGVSMGGRIALLVGLTHPEIFGVIGALQPAITVEEAPLISDLARAANLKASIVLRLVSSEADPFLPAVRAASERLAKDGVVHELLVVPGNHGYEFNRGPGGAEMLLWHERVQRGLKAP